EATSIWLLSVKELAAGIASLINAFDPEAILLGGGIARAGEPLLTPLVSYLDQFEWRPTGGKVRILPAQHGEWAGAYGAAHHALRSL
ncbi:MAG: ROK family protein, partial [Chthonomonadaceae bacterium]|nr:ROK family protein [Chthonomonadaceae bacterium]